MSAESYAVVLILSCALIVMVHADSGGQFIVLSARV